MRDLCFSVALTAGHFASFKMVVSCKFLFSLLVCCRPVFLRVYVSACFTECEEGTGDLFDRRCCYYFIMKTQCGLGLKLYHNREYKIQLKTKTEPKQHVNVALMQHFHTTRLL